MEILSKFSPADWAFGIVTGVIAIILVGAFLWAFQQVWRWVRSFPATYRRSNQQNQIVKVFVYRRYIKAATAVSLSRGHFFVLSRFLRGFIAGVVIISMGSLLGFLTDVPISFYLFLALAVWLFIEAASWLDPKWSKTILRDLDAQALADAAAILGETPDVVREQVTR